MTTLLQINPRTNGKLTVALMSGNTPLPDATVVADVYAPSGALIVSQVSVPFTGTGGDYGLTIAKEWSTDANGEAIEGVFEVEMSANRFGKIRTHRVKYLVQFTK